ncbi:4-alpha-glucanotransferase [Desulfallas sp. Bu1-1]|uniref:4-alpha-glucanotransferase n=1 Tax=Desulfallas sp. Bu1-1 TaxID=2787620 RepID=UPI00189E0708|nr:4-alpha-glucanotransferase [Desulfallas sp. Bu1-1]MBF7083820.1 4-alpha-glucanotransferase [Desulfallas sp. Bu1-1]
MEDKQVRLLFQLAGLYNVETGYEGTGGDRHRVPYHSLLAVLRALGAPVQSTGDVPGAIRQRRQEIWRRCCEPVAVVWEGAPAFLNLRLPAGRADGKMECLLELETGEPRRWFHDLAPVPALQGEDVEGERYLLKRIPLPRELPPGYHRLTLHGPGCACETMVIAAPARVYEPPVEALKGMWGVFLPLYALRSGHSWAAGDIADLERLLRWVRDLGGGFVGTLPLLAAFLDEPFEPSPYSPASRLFWNEFYLDVTRVPELHRCPPALELINSKTFQKEIAALRRGALVDYRRGMAVKRSVLQLLSRCHSATESPRREELRQWAQNHPAARDYARFRAAMERRRAPWTAWPERMRDGLIREGDFDPETEYYHLYVQWLAHEQFRDLAAGARNKGPGLYLDLPMGVHNAGYDVWRERDAFTLEASCGAPPDLLNAEGQNWDFSPLHPERIRNQGYRYYLAALRHHLRHAGVLRLDHVMGLHRLFWIPRGLPARDGVYVKYRAEEFYALLALESHRHRTLLVGEDLGVVPGYIRTAMDRHRVYRMYILPFEISEVPGRGINPVPARALTAMNTHDMPPFAAYWPRENPARRLALSRFLRRGGWLGAPAGKTRAVLEACLEFLAAGRARLLLVNLEDLWLETEPQNIPGTTGEYPNWRRKASKDFETFSRMPGVWKTLRKIDRLRKRNAIR